MTGEDHMWAAWDADCVNACKLMAQLMRIETEILLIPRKW